MLNPRTTSVSIYNSLSKTSGIIEDISIPARLKAVKNKTEIESIGRVMVSDGIALTRFLFWLEKNFGRSLLTEAILSNKLEEFRLQQNTYRGQSFAPVIAFNRNSALPHYDAAVSPVTEIGDRGIM